MSFGMKFCLFILIGLAVNAQTTINLKGSVSDKDGKPIANAIVTLVKQRIKDTTSTDGTYEITGTAVAALPLLLPRNRMIFIDKGFLEFSLPEPSPIAITIFDVNGNLLKKEFSRNNSTGFFRFNLNDAIRVTKLVVIQAAIGQDKVTFRYLSMPDGKYAVDHVSGNITSSRANRVAKMLVVDDTLKTTAGGFKDNMKAITSYEGTVNITLESVGSQSAGRSAGCGKPTTLKGEQKVMIGDRFYYIRLPDDYDVNTAYKLWFSIHCLGGAADGVAWGGVMPGKVAKGYEYYGMWKFANPEGKKGTTIFISPEGLKSKAGSMTGSSNALGWDNDGLVDVDFIRSIIDKVKGELCIDTTRIFSEGFSMGGSMSYALACAMPSTFKAICMHSGGAMSGCSQTKRGPVAMFITHGTNDPVCKYPDNSGKPQLADLAKQNSCTTMDITTVCKPVDSKPVCADYSGCNNGFPCRACIFVGGHDYLGGGTSANTWVDDSTWSFFKQFY